MKILLFVLRSLPVVVSIALSLGAGGLAADAIRSAVKRIKAALDASKTPLDNLLIEPLLRQAIEVAKEIESGHLGGRLAVERVKDLVKLLLAVLANTKN